ARIAAFGPHERLYDIELAGDQSGRRGKTRKSPDRKRKGPARKWGLVSGRMISGPRPPRQLTAPHLGPLCGLHPSGWTGRGPENRLTEPGFRGESAWPSTDHIRTS